MEKNIYIKLKKELPGIRKNVSLKEYTTFKIGGPAKYFFIAETKENLVKALEVSKKFRLPIFILGGGSNILVSDKGFNGLVVKIQITDIELKANEIFVGGGVMLPKLVNVLLKNSFTGLEWASGVPGTIGGAVYGNAQAFGTKVSDAIDNVEVLDAKTLKTKILPKNQCRFTLKNSIFKKNKNLIIVSVVLKLDKGNGAEIKEKINNYLKHRKTLHPTAFPSAGSVFVNPEIEIKNKKILEKFPELIEFNKNKYIPSGYLIEKVGLRGKKIGQAQISEKHANFIINLGKAKAKDILALMNLAKKKVKNVFKINLETEVQFVGFKK